MQRSLNKRWIAIALLLSLPVLFAQEPAPKKSPEAERAEYFRANYTKYEYMIQMRDGVRLFTSVYAPKDVSQKYPILLMRTPYTVSPYGADNFRGLPANTEKFAKESFIFVYQDVHGTSKSEGEYANMRPYMPVKHGPKDVDETTDSYDTIDWLVKNVPDNNGNVGIWGISYPGFYAAMAAIDAHPALKAASPQAPITDWFLGDDWRHNGALFLAHAFGFFSGFGRPWVEPGDIRPHPTTTFERGTPDGYDFFLRLGPLRNIDPELFGTQAALWKALLEHRRYDDYWQARNIRPHLKNIHPAILSVGGWYDAEDLAGPLAVYRALEVQSPETTRTLVMGPWSHGGWMGDGEQLGNVRFASKTGEYFRDKIMLPFFVHYLKTPNDDFTLPKAYVFETGRNQWRKHDNWPPTEAVARMLYLSEGGKLSWTPPEGGEAFDEYISDPGKPVPFTDETSPGMTYNYMTSDQRNIGRRTDVLKYESEPLAEDVTVAGPIECDLRVSTSGTDADWVVKLVDGYPGTYPDPDPNPSGIRMGGYQQLVRGEPFRARFRDSFERPEASEPGHITKIAFTMPDVYHTFRRGHRIVVHVQSSWFPLVDRNPQKFVDIDQAVEADFQKATERVYRSDENRSAIRVLILP
jgi:putative CocE/NonD family hydrolase